jgi:hypothetical protein
MVIGKQAFGDNRLILKLFFEEEKDDEHEYDRKRANRGVFGI